MDLDLIYRVIDQCSPYVSIYRPFGLGEPLVDPRLPDILAYIKATTKGQVELHTNAAALTPRKEAEIAKHVDIMRFSLDGFHPKTVGSVRKINGQQAIANTERFLRRYPDIQCEVRMVGVPEHQDEQQQFLDYWNSIRPDCATITKLYRHPWEGQEEATSDPCRKCQEEVFVYVDGSVHPCPWDFGNRKCLGNVKDRPLPDIWMRHKAVQFRDELARGLREKHALCSRCDAVF
jgi:radical SAM protein with 4Fe4S-binding SPASM domain